MKTRERIDQVLRQMYVRIAPFYKWGDSDKALKRAIAHTAYFFQHRQRSIEQVVNIMRDGGHYPLPEELDNEEE